jgi:hypothetical protein
VQGRPAHTGPAPGKAQLRGPAGGKEKSQHDHQSRDTHRQRQGEQGNEGTQGSRSRAVSRDEDSASLPGGRTHTAPPEALQLRRRTQQDKGQAREARQTDGSRRADRTITENQIDLLLLHGRPCTKLINTGSVCEGDL